MASDFSLTHLSCVPNLTFILGQLLQFKICKFEVFHGSLNRHRIFRSPFDFLVSTIGCHGRELLPTHRAERLARITDACLGVLLVIGEVHALHDVGLMGRAAAHLGFGS